MPELIFLADVELIRQPDGENPAAGLPSLHCQGIFREARAQLYANLMGVFFDEALELEVLALDYDGEGPTLYEFAPSLTDALAALEEDDIEALLRPWQETAEIEELGTDDADLAEFLFSLIHLCQISRNEDGLSVFVMSDG